MGDSLLKLVQGPRFKAQHTHKNMYLTFVGSVFYLLASIFLLGLFLPLKVSFLFPDGSLVCFMNFSFIIIVHL